LFGEILGNPTEPRGHCNGAKTIHRTHRPSDLNKGREMPVRNNGLKLPNMRVLFTLRRETEVGVAIKGCHLKKPRASNADVRGGGIRNLRGEAMLKKRKRTDLNDPTTQTKFVVGVQRGWQSVHLGQKRINGKEKSPFERFRREVI